MPFKQQIPIQYIAIEYNDNTHYTAAKLMIMWLIIITERTWKMSQLRAAQGVQRKSFEFFFG